MHEAATKVCSKCLQTLPVTSFHRRRHYVSSGVRAACKACTAATDAQVRRAHPPSRDARKNLVRARTRRAIATGLLVRKPCAECGATDVQPHHPDYSRPNAHLVVEWLCVEHHARVHGTRAWTKQLELSLGLRELAS